MAALRGEQILHCVFGEKQGGQEDLVAQVLGAAVDALKDAPHGARQQPRVALAAAQRVALARPRRTVADAAHVEAVEHLRHQRLQVAKDLGLVGRAAVNLAQLEAARRTPLRAVAVHDHRRLVQRHNRHARRRVAA
eukprot:4740680-Pleurochrysis_carterae.AAC.1